MERFKHAVAVLLTLSSLSPMMVKAQLIGDSAMVEMFGEGTPLTEWTISGGAAYDIDYAYGVYGKSASDAVLRIQSDVKRSDRIILSKNFHHAVKPGSKLHFRIEIAEENVKASTFWIQMKGKSASGNRLEDMDANNNWTQYASYQMLAPFPLEKITDSRNIFMVQTGGGTYLPEMGVGYLETADRTWNTYDIVIDPEDESYSGRQTVSAYRNGVLNSVAEYDPDTRDSDPYTPITEFSGIEFWITPADTGANTMYFDQISLSTFEKGEDPLLTVDTKTYTGSFTGGETVKSIGKYDDSAAFSAHGEQDQTYEVFPSDVLDRMHVTLPDNADNPVRVFFWGKENLSPFSQPYEFVPYNERVWFTRTMEEDADFRNMTMLPSGESPIRQNQAFYGKPGETDAFVSAGASEGTVEASIPSELEHGIKISCPISLTPEDSLLLSFDYAHATGASTKNIMAESNGITTPLVSIGADADPDGVRVNGKQIGLKMNGEQWYHFEIILNSDLRGNMITKDVYINGRLYIKEEPVAIGGSLGKADFSGIDSLTVSFCQGEFLPDGKHGAVEREWIYLDNIRLSSYYKSLPYVNTFHFDSAKAVYKAAIDHDRYVVYNYGQNPSDFIASLKGDQLAGAKFVCRGENVSDLNTYGTMLVIDTTYGDTLYYKVEQDGSEEALKDNLDATAAYNPDTTDWYVYHAPDIQRLTGSILDLSTLNYETAGSHGKIRAEGENFVAEDGTVMHFWGTNLQVGACIPENRDQAEAMANMIASYGFNLVRFHYVGRILFEVGSAVPKADEMERFTYFMKCLRDRGVYYYLDLNSEQPEEAVQKLTIYFNDTVKQLFLDRAKNLLTYHDSFTGKRICEDNALAGVQLVNEQHIYVMSLMDDNGPLVGDGYDYRNELNSQFDAWYRVNYPVGDTSYFGDYFGGKIYHGHTKEEAKGKIKIGTLAERGSGRNQWKDTTRQKATLQFLTEELQEKFHQKFRDMLQVNGIDVLYTGFTIFNYNDIAQLEANQNTDFIDTHQYWSHPAEGFSLQKGIVLRELESMLTNPNMGMIGYLMMRKPSNMPYTISEWNSVPSNQYSAEAPMIMAAYSKYQNWHPMMFAFDIQSIWNYREGRMDSLFNTSEHPITIATMPAAALLWRNVSEAESADFCDLSGTDYWDDAAHKSLLGTDACYGYDSMPLSFGAGLLAKTGVRLKGMEASQTPADGKLEERIAKAEAGGIYTTDTGEITFDSNQDTFAVNTLKSKAIAGKVKGETTVGDVVFQIDNDFAAVYVNAMDGEDIGASNRILLTAAGRVLNDGQVLGNDNSVVVEGADRVLLEQITGTIKIKTNGTKHVYALDSSGERKEIIYASYENGCLTIPMTLGDECVNYEITA